jgi:murein DD-endopeptidase MepM/ murein hydrolase activator NlpD
MRRRTYTIIISPSTLNPAKRFTIHRSTLWLILITVVILLAFGILGSLKFYEENGLHTQYAELRKEKEALEAASKILAQIRKKECMIKKFLGLETDSAETGEPGQGGPAPESAEAEDFLSHERLTSSLQPRLSKKKHCLSPCEEANLLDLDLQELIDFLTNQENELASLPTVCPVSVPDAWISSRFGTRKSPFTGGREFHSGLDISAMRGTPIIATGGGTVSFAGSKGGLGKTIIIVHNAEYKTYYGHLLKHNVKKGQGVKRGDIIGFVGKTGRTTGYHVHYEIRKNDKPVDPYPCILDFKKKRLTASAGSSAQ